MVFIHGQNHCHIKIRHRSSTKSKQRKKQTGLLELIVLWTAPWVELHLFQPLSYLCNCAATLQTNWHSDWVKYHVLIICTLLNFRFPVFDFIVDYNNTFYSIFKILVERYFLAQIESKLNKPQLGQHGILWSQIRKVHNFLFFAFPSLWNGGPTLYCHICQVLITIPHYTSTIYLKQHP